MEWLVSVAIGCVLGALATAFLMSRKHQSQQTQWISKQSELQLLQSQFNDIKQAEQTLRAEHTVLSQDKARLETLLGEAKRQFEDQQNQFEALSQKTLNWLKDEMEQKAAREYQEKQARMDEKLSDILKPLREVLDQNAKKVQELEKQHIEDTSSLKKHIELVVQETGKLVAVKNKLAEALSNSKGRGDWGEMELVRLLEESGLQEGIHYEAQRMENGLRPDVTIRLSNQRILYVDAKTIMVNLERLMAAEDSEEEAVERKKHAQALEKEILSLSLKAYESQCQESIDFVVLYVPRESMLRAALEERPSLMEQAFQRRVILASPLILMSILKTVAYGWDQAQLSRRAQEIQVLGKELHKRASLFVERLDKLGKTLEVASRQFDDTKTAFAGRQGMLGQLRKFEEYGCKSDKQLLDIEISENVSESQLLMSQTGLSSN